MYDTKEGCSLEHLRKAVALTPIVTSEGLVSVTVSIGACQVNPESAPAQWESDLRSADLALYRAKRDGRNRVKWHMPSSVINP